MDKLIIGAGLYGLYAALYCAKRGQQVEVLEMEEAPFTRATYIRPGYTWDITTRGLYLRP